MKGKVLVLASGVLVFFAAADTDVPLSPSIAMASQYDTKDVEVDTAVLNVRKSPTTSSQRITQITSGQVYTVLEQSGKWYKIQTSSGIGWIHGDYVLVVGSSSSKSYPEMEVNTAVLNVRLKPTTNSYRISQVKKGEKYTPIDESNGW
ncbi:SH3 domain-containing protein, partial [Clostridium sp. D2Q-14]|uniref:SH3 domain-containing protein n=1 Tax=Anaeromonas gelatinilytica TaxID=2683194 RepID=UPI00193B336F